MLLVVLSILFISFLARVKLRLLKSIYSSTMAPPKKPFEAASAKAYAGAQGIKRFFAVIQPKKKAGQPPKKRKKNGVIAANTSANATRDSPPMVNVLTSPPTVNTMVNALTSPPTVNALTTLKKTRINWGKGEHRDLLAKAIQDWLNKEGDVLTRIYSQTSLGSPRKLSTNISARRTAEF